jgi:CheY-like chemotaxis protein
LRPARFDSHVAEGRWRNVPARILVADDNPLARKTTRGILESQGLTVCAEAKDGPEAVQLARRFRPELIVLDWRMPGMNGLETARTILTSLPDVPIVLYTIFATDQLDQQARAIGVRRVVSKADVSALVSAVKSALAGHGS